MQLMCGCRTSHFMRLETNCGDRRWNVFQCRGLFSSANRRQSVSRSTTDLIDPPILKESETRVYAIRTVARQKRLACSLIVIFDLTVVATLGDD